MEVQWTSIDVIRIGVVGESFAPVILWIGVKPKSLTGEDGNIVAYKCRDILREFNIADVDVEIRESSVIQLAGPALLPPPLTGDPTVTVCDPLVYTLGLPISAHSTPYIAGTGGFFLTEGGDSDKLLLLTARHVVFPPTQENVDFKYKNTSQARTNVILLGDQAYKDSLESIETSLEERRADVNNAKVRIEHIRGHNHNRTDELLREAQADLEDLEKVVLTLNTLYEDVRKNWATPTDRILGHVVWSPRIGFGVGTEKEGYTEDYAIIQVDNTKIDKKAFKGNIIDLGTKMTQLEFTMKMYPNVKNPSSFKYPLDRLLKLSGIIPYSELYKPTSLDQDNELCLMVIKSGSKTGITIGRANGIMSLARKFEGEEYTTREWPILRYAAKTGPSGVFSKKGDSGAAVVDGLGRIGGLLTGGCTGDHDLGTGLLDITYATPIHFILQHMKTHGFPNAHLPA